MEAILELLFHSTTPATTGASLLCRTTFVPQKELLSFVEPPQKLLFVFVPQTGASHLRRATTRASLLRRATTVRGRTEIAPDQREKFLQRLQQVQGHGNLLGVPSLFGGNEKQFLHNSKILFYSRVLLCLLMEAWEFRHRVLVS
ncbi:hypothetical protein Bca101_020259 [Brassica carinata]